jgi:hypothetical protein
LLTQRLSLVLTTIASTAQTRYRHPNAGQQIPKLLRQKYQKISVKLAGVWIALRMLKVLVKELLGLVDSLSV